MTSVELLSSEVESCSASPSCAGEPKRLPTRETRRDPRAESGRESAESGRELQSEMGREPTQIVDVMRDTRLDGDAEPVTQPIAEPSLSWEWPLNLPCEPSPLPG